LQKDNYRIKLGSLKLPGVVVLTLVAGSFSLQGQETKIGFTFAQGINSTFIGNGSCKTKAGYSAAYGAVLKLQNSHTSICFEPYLMLYKNTLQPVVEEGLKMKFKQVFLEFAPVAGVKVSGDLYANAGIFMQLLVGDFVEIVSRNNGYVGTSFNDLYTGYDAAVYQAGIVAGISYVTGKRKLIALTLRVRQYATSPLDQDYIFPLKKLAQNNGVMYISNAKPTNLLAGVDFFLARKKKKKEEGQE